MEMNRRRGFLFRILWWLGCRLKTAWCLVGVSLAVILAGDLLLRLVFSVKDTWIDEPKKVWGAFPALRSHDDQAQPWQIQYESEHAPSNQLEWHSYVYWRRHPFEGKCINVDAKGIRNTWKAPSIAGSAQSSRPRIFVFGGSTVWGSAVEDEDTIPSFISKQIAATGMAADVINYGELGYVSTQEVLTLILRLQAGDVPNVVVFYDGLNDCGSTFQNEMGGLPQNEENRRSEFGLSKNSVRIRTLFYQQLTDVVPGLSRLADALRSRLLPTHSLPAGMPMAANNADRQQLAADGVRIYEANLKLVEALAQEYKFSCHFYWQPSLLTKQHLTDFESQQIEDILPRWKAGLQAIYEELPRSEALQHDCRFRDLRFVFDNVPDTVYVDWLSHVNKLGNGLIARQISHDILAELATPINPSEGDNDDRRKTD
jgi:hypothetical protein